ncbi:hypothetical protein [Mesorhizobium sp. B2-8-3]|uniref:hypothetical protein n=1 Tax=Mesorhizobium sp. B2-8-3 TaxID=2589905 RepID=UPI00116B71C4|nr:hypothetical protein [Mesorhizobium sp. B2-8-3]TPJ33386.1 hypothetical protein FJ418_15200 [Mesorhizobium sp. B2-8-3]
MPKGDWFSYLALGLIGGLGLALVFMTSLAFMNGYLSAQNPYSPTEQHDGKLNKGDQDHGYVEPFGQTSRDQIGKLEARENPDDSKYYEEQDRRAQKSMSDATEAMVFLTEVSIVLGLIGAGAIIWTLKVSRESNSIAREANEAQLRAYLLVKTVQAEFITNPTTTEIVGVALKVTVQNGGQTPAMNVGHDIRLSETILGNPPEDSSQWKSVPVFVDMKLHRVADVAPEGEIVVIDREIPISHFDSFGMKNGLSCHLHCRLQYSLVVSDRLHDLILNYVISQNGAHRRSLRIMRSGQNATT